MPGAIKIASNETVHGPLPSVREAIVKAAEGIKSGSIKVHDYMSDDSCPVS